MQFLPTIKRSLLALIIIMISSSISSARQTSRFSKTFFDPSESGIEENQEFSEGARRVKRQTRTCPFPSLSCNSPTIDTFRTIDGTCNNKGNPYCGAGDIAFGRYIPRDPPGSAFRCPTCPRVRDVSVAMNKCAQDNSDDITVMVMQWGQFIDHDLVFTPQEPETNCCQDFVTTTSTSTCIPIDVTNDVFYSSLSPPKKCLPFTRSKPATCGVESDRETINELTAYLDASMVYGSTTTLANSLRSFSGGKMKNSSSETLTCPGTTFDICPRSFLPLSGSNFIAGDSRVEEQPALTSIHTLFIRFHNDIANILNCGSDELTYQVTRKIVGAIVQQITFNEFLPIVLGNTIMSDPFYGVLSLSGSYSYLSSICLSAPNVFATAAFRFGHSLIPNDFILTSGTTVKLSNSFNNHGVTLNSNSFPSHFLGGICAQPSMPMDQILVDAVSNKLFATGTFAFGSDLYSRNMQRGRDHGIPGYTKWHNKCVKNEADKINDFSGLVGKMPTCVIDEFKRLYISVHDIDLFPAGIAEFPKDGGLIGPTFTCLIAEHFSDIKFGDRFWFQKSGVFTSSQVTSIRDTLLSSLICLYTNVEKIQPFVMKPVSQSNPLTSCSTILKKGVLNDITLDIWNSIC